MKSKSKINLILAFLLIVVSGVAYYSEFTLSSKRAKKEFAKDKIFVLEEGQSVKSIQIENFEKKNSIFLDCLKNCSTSSSGADWVMRKPIEYPADSLAISNLLSVLQNVQAVDSIELQNNSPETLARYGFSKELMEKKFFSISVDTEPAPRKIYLGDATPIGDTFYVYVDGPNANTKKIFLIPDALKAQFDKSSAAWRNKRIFDLKVSDIIKVTFKNSKANFSIFRKDSEWFLEGGKTADIEAIETFLTGLTFTNAKDFASDRLENDKLNLGINSLSASIQIQSKDSKTIDILYYLGKNQKAYIVLKGKSTVFEIDRPTFEKSEKLPQSFKFRGVLSSVERVAVEQVEINLKKKNQFIKLEADGSLWKLKAGTLEGFDSSKLDQFIGKLASIKVKESVSKKMVTNSKSYFEVAEYILKNKKENWTKKLSLYSNSSYSVYYIAIGDESEWGRLDASVVDSLVLDLKSLSK